MSDWEKRYWDLSEELKLKKERYTELQEHSCLMGRMFLDKSRELTEQRKANTVLQGQIDLMNIRIKFLNKSIAETKREPAKEAWQIEMERVEEVIKNDKSVRNSEDAEENKLLKEALSTRGASLEERFENLVSIVHHMLRDIIEMKSGNK